MHQYAFETIGTHFEITIWDEREYLELQRLFAVCKEKCEVFDALYSRFRSDSLVTRLYGQTGEMIVPEELVDILRLYERLTIATNGSITPTIGVALEDSGYDANYSLTVRSERRKIPSFHEALTIIDDTTIVIHEPVLLDFGALGKGYLIDRVFDFLQGEGIEKFLVNGSGDIRYQGVGAPIVAGLEHPHDATQAIGTFMLSEGALCASATNRRAWGEGINHYIDPATGASPQEIVATWVYAKTAAEADGLSSALFFVTPEQLSGFSFDYLVLNQALRARSSAVFQEGLFT